MNCLIMATLLEAKPFIELRPFSKFEDSPFQVFRHGDETLIISGIGKVNAAMSTTWACLEFRPKFVLNLGAAGATGRDSRLGDIHQISKAIEYDGFCFGSNRLPEHVPHLLPGFSCTVIATQDQPVLDPKRREELSSSAALVDMEASAVIQACNCFGIPCVGFKFVTDTPERFQESEIGKNILKHRLPFYRFISDSVLPMIKG